MKWVRLVFFLVIACAPVHAQLDSLYLKNRSYHAQRALYEVYRTTHADVVMFGNSITFGADWSELLDRPAVVNRGIPGDNTYGYLARIGEITRLHPRVCFVMGGVNDLFADIPVDTVLRNYRQILDTLRRAGIVPVIQSTLHVSPKWKRSAEKNPEITRLDQHLQALAHEMGIEYLDLDARLSVDNVLQDEFTTDGVHLTAPAYAIWADMVDAWLRHEGH